MHGLNVGRDADTRRSDRLSRLPIGRCCGGRGRLDGGDHAACSLEQRPSHRTEASAETQGRLGDPRPAPAQAPRAGSRSFQSCHRSKLRGCDLVRLQVDDVCAGGRVRDRATIVQKKTGSAGSVRKSPSRPSVPSVTGSPALRLAFVVSAGGLPRGSRGAWRGGNPDNR
jgi:hypothetical protein